ncbi:MAG: hypothetical protein QXI58_03730 [Candidatus Micrarchaeia archaeon]
MEIEKKKKERKDKEKEDKEKEDIILWFDKTNFFVYSLIISFVLFIIFRNHAVSVLFAFLSGISLILIFVIDVLVGVKTHGIKKEIVEIAKAAAFAVGIVIILMVILGTNIVPVSAIYSCSLLPRYERGDMVIIKKVNMSEINAPEIELSEEEFNEIYNSRPSCNSYGIINYKCSICERINSKNKQHIGYTVCIRELEIKGRVFEENFSNDVVVYQAETYDGKKGMEIIHRVFLKMKVKDKYYLLMKGDNNDGPDNSYFKPVSEENYRGKVILRIPLIGYLKLFLSLSFTEPKGCEMIYKHNEIIT